MFVLSGYDGSSGDALRVYVDVGAETTVVDVNDSDATNALIMNGVLIGATHNAFVLTRYDDTDGDAAKIYAPQNKETVVVDIDGVNVAYDLTENKILIHTCLVASGETVFITVDTPISGDAIIDGTVVFVGVDRILRISGNVTFGETASITTVVGSNGYLVTEPDVSVPESVLTGVKHVEYNVGASNFVATTTGATWESADPARSVLLERLVNGVWETMGRPTGESYTAQLRENASLRLFDGANFLTANVPKSSGAKNYWIINAWATAHDYEGNEDRKYTVVDKSIDPAPND